jgi:hypothetical protein
MGTEDGWRAGGAGANRASDWQMTGSRKAGELRTGGEMGALGLRWAGALGVLAGSRAEPRACRAEPRAQLSGKF